MKVVLGQEREYLTIKILHNDMTVNVPVDSAEKVGLRGVIDEETVQLVVKGSFVCCVQKKSGTRSERYA